MRGTLQQQQQQQHRLPPSDGWTPEDMWDYLSTNCRLFVFPEAHEIGLAATLSRSKNASWAPAQSFDRVAVYAKYGPGVLVEDPTSTMFDHTRNVERSVPQVRLKSGGKALLQPHELKQLLEEEHRSFLCEVYTGGDGVTCPIAGNGSRASDGSTPTNRHMSYTAQKLSLDRSMSSNALRAMPATLLRPRATSSASTTLPLPPLAHSGGKGMTAGGSQTRRTIAAPPPAATLKGLVAPNTGATALNDAVYGELMNRRHPLVYAAAEITRQELEEVLAQVAYPRAEKDGKPLRWSTLADAMSTALLAERQRRINALRSATPTVGAIRQDQRVTNRSAVFFYSRTHPKPRSIRRFDSPQDVLVALHRYAYQVSDVDVATGAEGPTQGRGKPTAAELNNNIKCLRKDYVADPTRPGWDATCCLQGTVRGGSKIAEAGRAAPSQ